MEAPRLLHLFGGQPYDYTFSFGGALSTLHFEDGGLAESLNSFVLGLYDLDVGGRLMLLDGLLDDKFDGRGLHLLFTYARDVLSALMNDPMGALYTPLSGRQGEFPLHADLYIPQILFNVFEKVPADTSGTSLFLSVPVFKKLLREVDSLPKDVHESLCRCLEDGEREDQYTKFYHLLYRDNEPWGEELARRMREKQVRIKLFYGQGYLLNDRAWLHGREAPHGGVPRDRLHRLIFNTRGLEKDSQAPPITSR